MLYAVALKLIVAFEGLLILYFLTLNSLYLIFSVIAFVELRRHRRRWTARDLDIVVRSPATPAISLIVPAHNEAATIRESLRSLLLLNYPQHEVVVVNDGSSDATLQVLIEAFELAPADAPHEVALQTQPIRGIYRSLTHAELLVIDKANGGKSDAINAGINAAKHPLVCVIDADSLLEEHALTRAVLPFMEDPTTVAAGGIIRIANGCRVEDGRVLSVGLPSSPVACFQVTEYLRAFLSGRVAHSVLRGLLIISGAFGVFRRDAVLAVGGFDTATVGEDMELIVRLHRYYRERGEPYRIVFRPDPVCWTEVPEQIGVLARQRNRWQRGVLQTLSRHRDLFLNPAYGVVGMCAVPYFVLFEALAPLVEAIGYGVSLTALAFGWLDWRFAELLFLAAVAYGALISVMAVILEEVSFRRYPRLVDLLKLSAYAVVENFGYRQLTLWWRLRGTYDFFRGHAEWGSMTRRGFTPAAASRTTSLLLTIALVLGLASHASAQPENILVSARQAAGEGRRADALASLEARLAAAPTDVDARLLYGLILSWEGRYLEARRELQQVVMQAPAYTDARVALMNVEAWSGDVPAARAAAAAVLAQQPGHRGARDLRERLDAANRPWSAGFTFASDSFSDGRDSWQEFATSMSRRTSRGSIIVRATEAHRFSSQDRQIEAEFYPRLRQGTYAFVGVGGSIDSTLYPSTRVAFDVYQSVGAGFEVSGGYRRLAFATTTDIYVGTVSRYVGNWMLIGKVFHVPGEGSLDSTSYHAGFRRYVGGDGASYFGATYSHGASREEIRDVTDILTLRANTVRGEIEREFVNKLRVYATVGTSRQERARGVPLWQTSVSGGLAVHF